MLGAVSHIILVESNHLILLKQMTKELIADQ